MFYGCFVDPMFLVSYPAIVFNVLMSFGYNCGLTYVSCSLM